jgi:hypothetical protein
MACIFQYDRRESYEKLKRKHRPGMKDWITMPTSLWGIALWGCEASNTEELSAEFRMPGSVRVAPCPL